MDYNGNCGLLNVKSCLSLQYFNVDLAEMSVSTLHEFCLLQVLFLWLQIFHFVRPSVNLVRLLTDLWFLLTSKLSVPNSGVTF